MYAPLIFKSRVNICASMTSSTWQCTQSPEIVEHLYMVNQSGRMSICNQTYEKMRCTLGQP
jgi:hypothetical protein